MRVPPNLDSGAVIDDPLSVRVADFSNSLYELTLQALSRCYIHQGETADELDTLARTAKHLMNWVCEKCAVC